MHKAWTRCSLKNYKILGELKDSRKPPTEVEIVKPQALDQSKREHIQNSMSWPKECSIFSKVGLFLSHHKDHITHKGARFQTSEECFPNQFLHPAKATRNHQIYSKNRKIKLQISLATWQSNKRWSTVSPLHLHIQHHPIVTIPRRLRLSQVIILPQATIQTKKQPFEVLQHPKYPSKGKP